MSKQLNVKLNFQADTSQVQQALNSLQSSLSTIANMTPTSGNKLSQDLAIAKQSAQELQMHLNNAFNMKTGNLDLGRLDASLKSSGQNLGQLSANLLKAGTSGEQAFLNIQRAVGNASVQINQANGMLSQFMTTLKNTARWQISSSILHGFVSAVQSAWGYAKDLDKSLNSIRIVTGYSSDKMADFAIEANKAAKALSTTTTKYTDASLIFYQQGLSDSEVQKRTDITIKMANAAGQSAEIVSDQLTAVWNNFYDGSKSLEYYADVMTALGAATASSTDEIAGGLEKFAAIGDTIGLSYEYAAAALATITSNTRQSEEVVGTALKTIFARIQGLKLGETLEDGTSLNKYSEALAKVGISIFEQNGELKKMDNILDEMGAKWDTLSSAQQAALAQTVAGTRQYTQLVALMKDWDTGDSDSMMANLETAYNSEGALQEQADIYADSWEAASDRAQAAAEGIYRDLFPTEELTGLMDGVTTILEGIDGLVQAFGGLQGILLLVSSIMLQTFQVQIGSSIDSIIMKVQGGLSSAFQSISNTVHGVSDGTLKWYQALGQIFGGYQNVVTSTQQIRANLQDVYANSQNVEQQSKITAQNMEKGVSATLAMSMEMTQAANSSEHLNASFQQYNTNMMQINNVQALIEQSARHLTKEQQSQLALLQEQAQAANEQMLTAQNTLDIEQQRKDAILAREGDQLSDIDRFDTKGDNTVFTSDILHVGKNKVNAEETFDLYGSSSDLGEGWAQANVQLEAVKGHLAVVYNNSVDLVQVNKDANNTYATMAEANAKVANLQKTLPKNSTQYREELEKISQELQSQEGFAGAVAKKHLADAKTVEAIEQGIKDATSETKAFSMLTGSSSKQIAEIDSQVKSTYNAFNNLSSAAENFKNKMSQVGQVLQNSLSSAMSIGQVMSTMASGFSSIAMGISSISNAFDTFEDEDASFTTKLTAGAMAATMGIRGLSAALGFLNTFIKSATTYTNLKNAADLASAAVNKTLTKEERKSAGIKLQNLLVTKLGVKEDQKAAVMKGIMTAAQKGETGATLKDTIANWANVASQAAKFWYISLIIAAIAALAAIIYVAITAEDAETKALRESAEALEKSTEAHEKAKQAVEDFKTAMTDYHDGVEGLKEVANEAEALKEAVEAVNEKARELIETYGLFGDFSYGEFGEIIIDDDALANAEKQLKIYEKIAASIRYADELRYNKAQQAQSKKDYSAGMKYTTAQEYTEDKYGQREHVGYLTNPDDYEERDYYITKTDEDGNTLTGIDKREVSFSTEDLEIINDVLADTKESLGGVPPTAEQLIEAIKANDTAYNGLSETIRADLDNAITDNILKLTDFNDSVQKATDATLYYAKEILGLYTDDEYADEISNVANGDSTLEALLYEVKDTLVAGITVDGKTADQYVADQEDKLSTDVLNNVSNWDAGGVTEDNIKEFVKTTMGVDDGEQWIKEHYSDIFGEGTSYSGNISSQDMGKLVLEAQGYEVTSTENDDGTTTYNYLDEEGKPQEITYDNSEAQMKWAELIGNYAIGEKVSGAATAEDSNIDPATFEKITGDIIANGEQMGADWSNAILSGIANGGDFDFSSLFAELSPSEIDNIETMDATELAKLFGLDETELKALGFSSAGAFKTAFVEGLSEYDEEDAKNALDLQYESEAEGLGIDKEEFKAYRDLLEANEEIAEAYEDNYEGLNKVALANKRMEKGVKKLADGWEDYNDVMSDSTSTAEDISAVLPDVNEGLQDILNVSDEEFELLPPDFAQKNWGLIQDVMNNVDGAVDKLRDKAGQEILMNVEGTVDSNGNLKEGLAGLHSEIAAFDANSDFEVGVEINDTNFIQKCNDMIAAAGMTAEQAQAYFASMGYDAKIKETTITKTTTRTVEYPKIDERTGYPTGEKGTLTLTEQTGTTGYAIESITPSGSFGGGVGVNTTAPGSATSGKNGGGGGGGSKPKKTEDSRKKKSEMVERYKEVNDQLDETKDRLDDVNRSADRLWGAARIKKMREANKEIQNEIDLLKRKGREIQTNLKNDLAALQQAADEANVPRFIVDENGILTNYEEIMTELFNRREALLDSFGTEIDEEEQKLLEDFDKVYDKVKDAADQYDSTREEDRENKNAEQEARERIQDNNADILSYELELKITINDNEMKKLEYYLSKTEDDFYQMAEAAEIMLGSLNPKTLGEGGQLGIYLQNLKDLEDQAAKLDQALANGDISPEAYHEGMQEIYDSIYENLGSLEELDKAMKNYYGDTLAAAGEEIGKYTERMEHLTSVLSHYKTILELTGKSTNYKALGEVLKGQAKTTKNSMEAAKKEYEMYESEVAKKKALLDEAIEKNDKEKIELYQKEYDAAIAASNEAQERYLSSAEEYAESLKAILENSLNEYAQDLENALTGGTSFDQMTTKMERAASLQEEYLTTTNKIYETNKLMNQAQQEIDKSTNSVAQKRLKQFINETDQLQKKNKLSQYELEIQQAKYDLLLAEIALEEAQEAKSTVRLQRDSEGNFGYVYTADQSKVDEAAQKLADTQNALYNIALEGANGYAEKYQQTLSEMYSTLTDLQQQYLDGAFESEAEYQAAMEEAKAYYYEKLEQYSSLHAIAISTDARVIEDAWSSEFSTMIYETETWKDSVETYVQQVSDAFVEWSDEVDSLRDGILGESLGDIKGKVDKITLASDELLTTLTKEGGVLDVTQQEIDKVSELTTAYINQNKELEKQINNFLALADAIQKKKEAEANPEDGEGDGDGDGNDNGNGSGNGNGNGNGTPSVTDPTTKQGVALAIWNGSFGWGTGETRKKRLKEKGFNPDEIQKLVNNTDPSAGWGDRYGISDLSKYAYSKFDTGGYTGSWGSYGKFAMLHEKELVLNKQDTENFLMSMEILDNIIKTIDLQTMNSQLSGLLNSPSFGNFGAQETLEQNVTIEANFPNVSSRSEIEEAFTTLVNRASQYANRK